MKPSSEPGKISHSKARNAALMNQLGTPGLGTLMAGQWLAGIGQLVLFLAGFLLLCAWAIPLLINYYRMAFSDNPPPPSHGGILAGLGVLLCVVSWFWSLATSVNLMRDSSKPDVDPVKSLAAGQIRMNPPRITSSSSSAPMPGWERNGEVISRVYEFQDFVAALAFVNAVGEIAELAQHHPDVDIRWNKVRLAFTTHAAGGLTEKDLAMARQCDGLSLR
jgi:4a-hydroxytetrahydrobiopterin dehydratase